MTDSPTFAVRIVQFPPTRVAAVEHRGPASQEYAASARLIAWRVRHRLRPSAHKTFGLHHLDPGTAARSETRVDFCVATDDEIAPNPEGVVAATIPGCRCAVATHRGSRANNLAAAYLWHRWLPASGERASGLPMIFHYVNVGPDVKDADMVTDVYLPLA